MGPHTLRRCLINHVSTYLTQAASIRLRSGPGTVPSARHSKLHQQMAPAASFQAGGRAGQARRAMHGGVGGLVVSARLCSVARNRVPLQYVISGP